MDIHDLEWQTRGEMPFPTNPLQALLEILASSSSNTAENKMLACIYGICVGWDEASYTQLKKAHSWTDEQVERQVFLHERYKEAWMLFMENEEKKKSIITSASPFQFC